MGKTWRNEADLKHELGSFAVELILAEIQDLQGPAPSLEEGLQRFFLYIAQTGLKTPILSGHAQHDHTSGVIVLDPYNAGNNVTSRMTESERLEIVAAAQTAWETLMTANHSAYKGETTDLWREVFGSPFTTDAEEVAA
jgi:hypothetical protein